MTLCLTQTNMSLSTETCGHSEFAYKCVAIRHDSSQINDFILGSVFAFVCFGIIYKESTCWRLNDLSPLATNFFNIRWIFCVRMYCWYCCQKMCMSHTQHVIQRTLYYMTVFKVNLNLYLHLHLHLHHSLYCSLSLCVSVFLCTYHSQNEA